MKINPKINKRVNESVADCRKVLTEATIELLKKIAEPNQVVVFNRILILYPSNGNVTATVLADRIVFEDKTSQPFYLVYMDDESTSSSYFLSLSNMQIIYDEVRRVIREY